MNQVIYDIELIKARIVHWASEKKRISEFYKIRDILIYTVVEENKSNSIQYFT